MVSDDNGTGMCVGGGDVHACVQACSAVHPLSLASTAAVSGLVVGLYMRESNQPRPGVAPGDPQHKAEGWTSSSGAENMRRDAASRRSLFVRERKDPAKMTYSRMALIKRDLLATTASANSQ